MRFAIVSTTSSGLHVLVCVVGAFFFDGGTGGMMMMFSLRRGCAGTGTASASGALTGGLADALLARLTEVGGVTGWSRAL